MYSHFLPSTITLEEAKRKKIRLPEITVHGRFQPPLHINHYNYLQEAFKLAEKVKILITNPFLNEPLTQKAPHRNLFENNPFTYEERVKIFKSFFKTTQIPESRYTFMPFDIKDDKSWEKLNTTVPNLINTYSPWSYEKLRKFEKNDCVVIHSSQIPISSTSGTKIRKIINSDALKNEKIRQLINAGYMREAINGLFQVIEKDSI